MSYYEETEARRLVIEAGLRLVREGLIARTWGNISARISEEQFVITPSGRAYDDLKPEELVVVNVADCAYEGEIKPSSEKGVHAAAYRLRSEVNFIIHTHQYFASAVGVVDRNLPFAPCAAYGLPGTKKLWDAVEKVIAENPDDKAILMSKHGALCLGDDYDQAFAVVEQLEKDSRAEFILQVGFSEESQILNTYGCHHSSLRAYVDDFAQIVGAKAVVRGGAVQVPESDDSEAVQMIVSKNCAAALYAGAVGGKPLSMADASLQRVIYLTKYSKQNVKNKK